MGRSPRTRERIHSRRVYLLFGAGCFRVAWYAIQSEPFQLMLEAVELAADGGPRPNVAQLRDERPPGGSRVPWNAAEALRWAAAYGNAAGSFHDCRESANRVACYIRDAVPEAGPLLETLRSDILRRPEINLPDSWRTSAVITLARGMYETRDFTGMPPLADELQEAGCEEAEVLDHARNPAGVHARGCWLVDAILRRN